jgi:hypothetical protein
VREEIESRGWQLKREKENVRIYKQPNSFWLFAPKIKLTLSPFYACVEVPERYREEFLKTISELNAKLY